MALAILLAHNSELIRTRFLRLASAIQGVSAVYGTASLAQAISSAERNLPRVIMLGTNLPDCSAVQSVKAMKLASPYAYIAMLSDNANPIDRRQCLQSGADQFFDTSVELETALDWIRQQAALL